MKKVWILEGFISVNKINEDLDEWNELLQLATKREQIETCLEMIEIFENKLDANPNGYWLAYQGSTSYKQFCHFARSTMRNLRKDRMTWRVVEGLIEETAKTWQDYRTLKENVGVMKYLWATL